MRKVIVLLLAALMALAFGLGLVWATPAEKADLGQVFAAATESTPEAFPENLTGEVVAVEKGRRTMTVKQSGLFTSKEVTFAVAEPVAPMLAELQPGDLVMVGYVEPTGSSSPGQSPRFQLNARPEGRPLSLAYQGGDAGNDHDSQIH